MEPPRVEQPRQRMEPPKVDPPRFEQPRVENPRMEQLEVGFRFEPPQKVGPIRNEPQREPFRFDQPYEPRVEFRNEYSRNEPYRPPQNWRNMFGFHNNDRQNYGRNGYDG